MPDADAPMLTDLNATTSDVGQASQMQTVDADGDRLTIKFWGVRGSVPTPGADTLRYGGNTACVEILMSGQRLIFDGGTGLRVLGKQLLSAQQPITGHIFFTHTHWDRIQGFPFFAPAFIKENHFDVYGAAAANGASIKQRLTEQMLRPNFFVPFQHMIADMTFHNIAAGKIIHIGEDITIETIALNAETGALGFRINHQGKSVVYATDSLSTSARPDPNLLYLAQDAELLIYGGTYSAPVHNHAEETLPMETCEQSIAIADKTQVKEMILFHHNPLHDDNYLAHLEVNLHQRCPQLRLAREGMELHP